VILDPIAKAAGLEALVQEFALGDVGEYLVRDGGLHRPGARDRILSPGDDSRDNSISTPLTKSTSR
jgi:hypothetical protein